MITVIVPTIWKASTFEIQLTGLCDCDYVDEVILINNDQRNTPNYNILNNKKITHISFYENIFVNPAWNIGVSLSANNNICLLNDDILFDIEVFKFMSFNKNISLCGIDMFSENEVFVLEKINERPKGFGCMMFLRKDKYHEIPKEFLVFYGDDYLFRKNILSGNENYCLKGCINNNVYGKSSTGLMASEKNQKIICSENMHFKKYFK